MHDVCAQYDSSLTGLIFCVQHMTKVASRQLLPHVNIKLYCIIQSSRLDLFCSAVTTLLSRFPRRHRLCKNKPNSSFRHLVSRKTNKSVTFENAVS
jgi:hypothetical protein